MKTFKKVLLVTGAVLVSALSAFAEDRFVIDFETTDYAAVSAYDWWEASPFRVQPGQSSARINPADYVRVVDNPYAEPDVQTGVAANDSHKVLAFQRSRQASNMFGARIDLTAEQRFELNKTTQYVHVLMHKPVNSRAMLIGLGRHNSCTANYSEMWASQPNDVVQFTMLGSNKPAQDMWSDVVFPVKGAGNIDIYSLVVVVDCEDPHGLSDDFVAYIDKVTLNDRSTPSIALAGNYAISFDPEQVSRSDRYLNSVSIVCGGNIYEKTVEGRKSYTKAFDDFIYATPGSTVQVTGNYQGNSMHSFVYFDKDNNGKFDVPADLVASNTANGNGYRATNTFTIPSDLVPGVYRLRFKVDWSDTEPAGSMVDGNDIIRNGGCILDALFYISPAEGTVSVSNDQRNGEIVQADGTSFSNYTHPLGTPLTVKARPESGFSYAGMTLTYGEIGGEEEVNDNPQYLTKYISYKKFSEDDTYTIPARYLKSDLLITGDMVETANFHPATATFPYVSPEPEGGSWSAGTMAYHIKNYSSNKYVTTTAVDDSQNLKLTDAALPTTDEGLWVVCGDDEDGYRFYNVEAGATKVLGMTGSEGTARIKLYNLDPEGEDITVSGITTRFFPTANGNKGYVFRMAAGSSNCWNYREPYLALWENNGSPTNDGSTFVFSDPTELEEAPVDPVTLTYRKGTQITAQNTLQNGDLILLPYYYKGGSGILKYTGSQSGNLLNRQNYGPDKTATEPYGAQYVWEVVNVNTATSPATFQLRNLSNKDAYLPTGFKRNDTYSGTAAANLYMVPVSGSCGDNHFALSFTNVINASNNTYHFNSDTEAVGFWEQSTTVTNTSSQVSFAIYKAVAETEAPDDDDAPYAELLSESLTNAKWLQITNANNTSYAMATKSGDSNGSNLHTALCNAGDEGQLFALVGDNNNGFVIYNKALGSAYSLKTTGTGDGTAATWTTDTPQRWYLNDAYVSAQNKPGYVITPNVSSNMGLNMYAGAGGDAKFYGAGDGGTHWLLNPVSSTPTVVHYVVSGTKAHQDANNYVGLLKVAKGSYSSNAYVTPDYNGRTEDLYLPKGNQTVNITNTKLHGWDCEVTENNGEYTVTYTAEKTDYQYLALYEHADLYRIPAIAKAQNGDLVAIYDYRVCHADVGNGEVDQVMRRSTNNGAIWTAEETIADGSAKGEQGNVFGRAFGDPALVADRESGNMTLITVSGQTVYGSATATQHPMVAAIFSSDNGQHWGTPVDITSQFWGSKGAMFQDEDTEAEATSKGTQFAYSGFFGSGKILQSRFTKVGSYYRLYAAMLCRGKNVSGAYVVYSDDMGRTWSLLGGDNSKKSCSGSDEPKVEELPDGSIVLSGRKSYGRYFNIWTWTTKPTAANKAGAGSWGTDVQSNQQPGGISVGSNSCNGEILLVDVTDRTTGQPAKLMLQSLPSGNSRDNVEIWYKDVTDASAYSSVSTFASNWTKGLRVSTISSAYSTMTEQADGRIGFFYEEGPATYCMVYVPLTIAQITNNAYVKEETPAEIVEETYTLNPASGETVESLEAICVEFTGQNAGAIDWNEQTLPTLTKQGSEPIEGMVFLPDNGYAYLSFEDVSDGTWTLTVPDGLFVIKSSGTDADTPVKGFTATYTVGHLPFPEVAATRYVTIENHETGRMPFLYNDIQYADEITLQGTSVDATKNGYVWKVTSDGNGYITNIVNAENGKGIKPKGNSTGHITTFQYTPGVTDGYYNLINSTAITGGHDRLNAANNTGAFCNEAGLRAVTTWNGAHGDNDWKFNILPTEGLTEYTVSINQPTGCKGYAVYGGKKAADGGFFLAPATLKQADISIGIVSGFIIDGVTLSGTAINVTYKEDIQTKINDLLNVRAGTVGYPYEDDSRLDALKAYKGTAVGDANYDAAVAAYNTVTAITDVVLPEPGHAYKLSVRSSDGARHWFLKNDGGVSTDEVDAAIFVMGASNDEDFGAIFVTNNNGDTKYLKSNGTSTATYAESYCDFQIVPMVTASNSFISTDKPARFGTFYLKAMRRHDQGESSTTNGTIILKEGNQNWDKSMDPYMNGTFTSAIEMTEVEYPYTKPKLVKNEDAPGAFASIWLPFPMLFPDGVEVYKGTQEHDVNGHSFLGLKRVDTNLAVAKGGYILYSENLTGEIGVQPVAGTPEDRHEEDDAAFYGTTEDCSWEIFLSEFIDATPYVLANKSQGIGFYKYTGTAFPKGKAIWMAPNGGAETVKFNFDDVITALNALHGNTANAEIFDLQGRRLDKTAKGVNIVSGKKMIK